MSLMDLNDVFKFRGPKFYLSCYGYIGFLECLMAWKRNRPKVKKPLPFIYIYIYKSLFIFIFIYSFFFFWIFFWVLFCFLIFGGIE